MHDLGTIPLDHHHRGLHGCLDDPDIAIDTNPIRFGRICMSIAIGGNILAD